MKKSRLIPAIGVLLLAVVFTVSKFSKQDNAILFLSTDNMAYADEGSGCLVPRAGSICIVGNITTYNVGWCNDCNPKKQS